MLLFGPFFATRLPIFPFSLSLRSSPSFNILTSNSEARGIFEKNILFNGSTDQRINRTTKPTLRCEYLLPFVCRTTSALYWEGSPDTQDEREAVLVVVVAVQLGRRRLGAVLVPPSAECGDRRRRRLGATHPSLRATRELHRANIFCRSRDLSAILFLLFKNENKLIFQKADHLHTFTFSQVNFRDL